MRIGLSTIMPAVIFIMATQSSNAAIRRVGYLGTPLNKVDYATLQSAHDAAEAGDTILIFPGIWNATYSKKLVTLGYGYFTDTSASALGTKANPGLQNIKGTLSIQIFLAAGSSNCTFEGLDNFYIHGDGSGVTLTGVTIRRCEAGSIDMSFNNVQNSWQVLQSYVGVLYLSYGNAGVISDLTIDNSYIEQVFANDKGTAAKQSGQFNNCVFNAADFDNGSFTLKNNIIINNHDNDANCVYQYNLFNTNYGSTPSGTGNIGTDGGSMTTTVFAGYNIQGAYSNDSRWALKAGSSAKGKGQGGTDMGIYGGDDPYKLSGIPRIPAVYKFAAHSTTTSGNPYTIILSVRSDD